jgi:hypothetical protein
MFRAYHFSGEGMGGSLFFGFQYFGARFNSPIRLAAEEPCQISIQYRSSNEVAIEMEFYSGAFYYRGIPLRTNPGGWRTYRKKMLLFQNFLDVCIVIRNAVWQASRSFLGRSILSKFPLSSSSLLPANRFLCPNCPRDARSAKYTESSHRISQIIL